MKHTKTIKPTISGYSWMTPDPLAEKYYNISPYVYCLGNPIKYIDPDGQKVKIVFNKETNKLYITDLDHYKKGLPTKYVSAQNYQLGGIRDKNGKLTYNQILIVNNVFSGGEVDNEGTIVRNIYDTRQKAIPNGNYDLTEYEGNSSWYKVDPIDDSRYDDKHQGYTNADGNLRSGYRLHLGQVSHGCITVSTFENDKGKEWEIFKKILTNTSKEKVPKREGLQKYIPWTNRLKYGEIEVKGKEKENIKKITR